MALLAPAAETETEPPVPIGTLVLDAGLDAIVPFVIPKACNPVEFPL
jgi:hypothetical protein